MLIVLAHRRVKQQPSFQPVDKTKFSTPRLLMMSTRWTIAPTLGTV